MSRRTITRRRFLATSAAASAAAIGFPYIRTSHAAGRLAVKPAIEATNAVTIRSDKMLRKVSSRFSSPGIHQQ